MFLEKEIQNRIIKGNILDVLKQFPDECIDLVITSPPYYGLRSYLPKEHPDKKKEIGLEDTFEQYINNLMGIFREIKRVLKKTGSFYLNIGDSYGGSQGKNAGYPDSKTKAELPHLKKPQRLAKCLMGIPERFMLKMIDEDGWIVRNKIIWYKKNHMPSPVKDRLACSYEPIYHFVKNNKGSDWYVYGNECSKEKFPKKYKIWLSVPEKYRIGCWHKDKIPKELLPGFLNLDYYYDLDIIREPHKFISLQRYKRAMEYGSVSAPDSKMVELKKKGGDAPQRAPKSFQAVIEGQKMSISPKDDGICAVPKDIKKNWKERNDELGYPEKPPKGISLGGGQTGLKKKFEKMDKKELDLFGSPRAREERLKRGRKGGEFENLFIEAKINPNDICPFCGRTYRRHVGIQSGKTKLMLCSKRNKTADESSFKTGGMRQAPEPGEEGAFNIKGKNPSDLFDVTTAGFAGSHFAVFPISLLIRPILSSCPINGVVLDPFIGSGTTGLVVKVLKRKYVGIDINEKYMKMAEDRIKNLEEREKVMIKFQERYPEIYEKFIGQGKLF